MKAINDRGGLQHQPIPICSIPSSLFFYRCLREILLMECTEITSRIKVSRLTSQENRYD